MPTLGLGSYNRRLRCRAPVAGFSLLEMLLVLVLIGIVMVGFLAGVSRDSSRALVIEANRLQAVLEQLTYQALITGEPHGVVLSAVKSTHSSEYQPVVWREKQWLAIDLPGLRRHQIDNGDIASDLSIYANDGASTQRVWKVSPQGLMDAGTFYFYNHDNVVLLRLAEDASFSLVVDSNEVPESLNYE